jgi:lactoylglutathione lyase
MTNVLINIDVDDLEKAIAFYTAAFDLHPARRFGPYAIELLGAEAPIYLLKKRAASPPFPGSPSPRTYDRHWTPVHLDFPVPDLEAALTRATHAGAHLEGPIQDHPWGRLALLSDPFGHGFCLIEFKGRGYDEVATPTASGQRGTAENASAGPTGGSMTTTVPAKRS